MKKIIILFLPALLLTGCCGCEKEPIVAENQKLIVPPDFGKIPGQK